MSTVAPLSVLVVDDEVRSLETLRRTLEDHFTIYTAECADDALEVMERECIQIVMSDQRMPGMSGVEFLRARAAPVARHHPHDPVGLHRRRGHHHRHQRGGHLAVPAQALAARTSCC